MTVTELRKFLEEEEKNGHGDCDICVVSAECQPMDYNTDKYTTDIRPYFDTGDNTFTIVD